jgi:hypothetical protein
MMPSAALAGAIAGILAVAVVASHICLDAAFRLIGG